MDEVSTRRPGNFVVDMKMKDADTILHQNEQNELDRPKGLTFIIVTVAQIAVILMAALDSLFTCKY